MTRLLRKFVAATVVMLLVGCQVSPGQSTAGPETIAPPGTGLPAATLHADATAPPVDDGPLPNPTLGSIDDVVAAMADPAAAAQVVVSMLQQLGIGLYEADGTAIRTGTETSDQDFYLFEPAARGLAAMLRDRDDADGGISFRDFHAALVSGGYGGSAEQLAAAFADAYATQPDATMSRLIAALEPVDVDATLPEFEVWLLMLDGFIAPNRAASALAMAGDAIPAVAAGGSGWGVARRGIQAGSQVPPDAWVETANLLRAVLHAWNITVAVSPAAVHEGHGGLGSPATLIAQLAGPRLALVSPFSGVVVVPAASGPAGIPVAWVGSSTLDDHGSIDDLASTVDASGRATTAYTPRQEAANGNGIDREDIGRIHAGYLRRDLILQLYGEFAVPYLLFFGGFKQGETTLYLDWHEKAEAVIKIVWTDTYDGVADTITFLGNLTATEPDPVSGAVLYTGTGTASGARAGWARCNPGIDVVPSGTVDATFNGYLTGTGSIMISAYADVFTVLAGISTAPMEVPIVGGFAQFDSPTIGELCPHGSHGEMTVTSLVLP